MHTERRRRTHNIQVAAVFLFLATRVVEEVEASGDAVAPVKKPKKQSGSFFAQCSEAFRESFGPPRLLCDFSLPQSRWPRVCHFHRAFRKDSEGWRRCAFVSSRERVLFLLPTLRRPQQILAQLSRTRTSAPQDAPDASRYLSSHPHFPSLGSSFSPYI